ncbi:MAG TPA: ACP S-malonyltransferase [Planctomycetota bacterium]|nr:ACP S-malonyltransferase [Planctomycetota bacterium]
MKDTVLVFPGQGAQAVGMGKDLAGAFPSVRALFDRADELLGFALSKTIFEGPDTALVDTSVQQPALVLAGLAVKTALETKLGKPLTCAAAAGLSLGEYAALASVGALSFEDAIKLVRKRGELMKMASEKVPCGMSVIVGLDADKIRAACAQAAQETGGIVSASNFNGGGQIVIGGAIDALTKAGELIKAAGARRVMRLAVAGAFHTELMRPAADEFASVLDAVQINEAQAPVYANVSASPVKTPTEIRDALKRQIVSPVLWEQTVKNLGASGLKTFVELGPGSTLSGMIKRIVPDAECRNVSNLADVEAFALWGL